MLNINVQICKTLCCCLCCAAVTFRIRVTVLRHYQPRTFSCPLQTAHKSRQILRGVFPLCPSQMLPHPTSPLWMGQLKMNERVLFFHTRKGEKKGGRGASVTRHWEPRRDGTLCFINTHTYTPRPKEPLSGERVTCGLASPAFEFSPAPSRSSSRCRWFCTAPPLTHKASCWIWALVTWPSTRR